MRTWLGGEEIGWFLGMFLGGGEAVGWFGVFTGVYGRCVRLGGFWGAKWIGSRVMPKKQKRPLS